MSDMEKITQLTGELQKGLSELEATKQQFAKDQDTLLDVKAKKIAEELTAKFQTIQDEQQAIKARLERVGSVDGEQADGSDAKAYKAAFGEFLRKGQYNLSPENRKLLATTSNPDGGFAVPTAQAGVIMGRIFQTTPMRSLATVLSGSNKSIQLLLDDGEAQTTWEGEASTVDNETNTPNLGEIELTARKLTSRPSISDEMLADASFDVESWLQSMLARDFARAENAAFVNGNGVSAPRGFLTFPNVTTAGVYQRNAIEQVANGSTSAITETGLINLMGSLKAEYHPNAVFMMNQATFTSILLTNGSANYRFLNLQPSSGAQGGNYASPVLMEKRVVLAQDMPTIATNALAVAFGDFARGYTIYDRQGLTVLPNPYQLHGRTRYYTNKRVGADVTNFEAIKLLRCSLS